LALAFQDIDGGVANTATFLRWRTANCELTQGLKFGGYAIVKNQFALRGSDLISDF
jgi:hypothetical protein